MCSWCWGFAPVLDQLLETNTLPLRIVIGGLRPGAAAQQLDETLRSHLTQHWKHVEQASGQTFNYQTLERENWLYDTELAAKAIVAMRTLEPEYEYPFFKHLQEAFYKDAIDITDSSVYEQLLEPYPIDPNSFISHMLSEEIKHHTYQDFALTRHLGIHGFPSLLFGYKDDLVILSRGYQAFERLNSLLESQLTQFLAS